MAYLNFREIFESTILVDLKYISCFGSFDYVEGARSVIC